MNPLDVLVQVVQGLEHGSAGDEYDPGCSGEFLFHGLDRARLAGFPRLVLSHVLNSFNSSLDSVHSFSTRAKGMELLSGFHFT